MRSFNVDGVFPCIARTTILMCFFKEAGSALVHVVPQYYYT